MEKQATTIEISTIRKDLFSSYADAAACLYGVLSVADFVGIFNYYEEEKTDVSEVFWGLQQLLETDRDFEYELFEDFIVGPTLHPNEYIEDLEKLNDLRQEQNGKPRYLPRKEVFLRFSDPGFIEPAAPYNDLKSYMIKNKFINKAKLEQLDNDMFNLHEMIECRVELTRIVQYFIDEYRIDTSDMDKLNDFLRVVTEVYNNTRLFENNGFTPAELRKVYEDENSNEFVIHRPKKIGRNDPCPCGSGKKFKKCCDLIDSSEAAQLTHEQRKQFYETWYKLLDYVNRKLNVVDYEFSLSYLDFRDETLLHEIREVLWKSPKLISEFIAAVDDLTQEEIDLLTAWEKHHIKGKFMLIKHTPIDSIFMCLEKSKEARLYAVKGMTSSIASSMKRKLPVVLETVLLPFKDVIIYDSFITANPIEFDSEFVKLTKKQYIESEEKYGIVAKF